MIYYSPRSDELYHYGILGMKWGVRRYENPDGTLTPAGKKRYAHMYRNPGNVSKTTQRAMQDWRSMSDKKFRSKYHASKDTYAKRVKRYKDPYMNAPLAKLGKKLNKLTPEQRRALGIAAGIGGAAVGAGATLGGILLINRIAGKRNPNIKETFAGEKAIAQKIASTTRGIPVTEMKNLGADDLANIVKSKQGKQVTRAAKDKIRTVSGGNFKASKPKMSYQENRIRKIIKPTSVEYSRGLEPRDVSYNRAYQDYQNSFRFDYDLNEIDTPKSLKQQYRNSNNIYGRHEVGRLGNNSAYMQKYYNKKYPYSKRKIQPKNGNVVNDYFYR